nr:hypothetical protein [Tanacetum cinerariifolium]
KELKQVEADDQFIHTILLGLPEDIYAAIDNCETAQKIWLRVQQMMKGFDIGIQEEKANCETAQEIWLRVQQMMKGSDIEIQEKKAKLFNEWERFTSNERESIESYYHRFLKLTNDLKRNKHFPEKIASNLKQIAQPGMNMGKDRQIQMVGGNGGNQFRQYVGNLTGYNDVIGNKVI